ncbi:MAG: LamG-like jellyroll fold domain-containing protein [Planctomycetota bacterium]
MWDLTADVAISHFVDRSTTWGASPHESKGNESVVLTPDVDTSIEIRLDAISAGADIRTGTTLQIVEIGAVQADVVGGLEFMDIIEVTSPVASVTFGAAGDGAFQRALDGDVDEEYEMAIRWPKVGLALETLEVYPNGVDPGANATFDRLIFDTTISGSAGTGWAMVHYGTAGGGTDLEVSGTAKIMAKTGLKRTIRFDGAAAGVGAVLSSGHSVASTWHDDSTNITSLEVINESANLPVGTSLVLYRRTRANLRADSASTYERAVPAAVAEGTNTTEYTTGLVTHGGSVVGVSALLDLAVTAGTVAVNIKVAGTTKLTVLLDTTNTTSGLERKSIGSVPVNAGEEITVEIVATGYTNASTLTSGIMVQVKCIDSAQILDGAQSRRVAQDSTDLLVFEGDVDGSGNLLNTGSDALAFMTPSGTPENNIVGFFSKAVGVVPRTSANLYVGGVVEPTQGTLSCWIRPRAITGTQWLIIKPPFVTQADPWSCFALAATTSVFDGHIVVGGVRTSASSGYPLVARQWQHLGVSYNSSTGDVLLYHDGRLVGSANTGGGVIDYQNNQPWRIGDSPGGAIENADSDFSDVRLSSTVRDAAWFEDVWRRGMRLT